MSAPAGPDPDTGWGGAARTLVSILALIVSIAFVCALSLYVIAWLTGAGWETAA